MEIFTPIHETLEPVPPLPARIHLAAIARQRARYQYVAQRLRSRS